MLLLIKLANLLDKYGYYKQANYIDQIIKQSSTIEFYHGTSSVFLHKILKEGLNPGEKRVWDENRRDKGSLGLESYPGAYVSTNFMTALSAAGSAVGKFGGNRLIVVGKIETKSPQVRIDEDHVREPGQGIAIQDKIVSDWHRSSQLLDYHAFDSDNDELEQASKVWVEQALGIKPTQEVLSRATKTLRAWLDMRIALELENEPNKWSGMTSRLKKRFGDKIPDKYTDANKAVKEYRKNMDEFLAKAKELVEKHKKDTFIFNVRMTDPVKYKGSNKIEAIIEIEQKDYDTPAKIKVHYATDVSIVSRMIKEFEQRVGQNYEVI
jgi:hypothetical protein